MYLLLFVYYLKPISPLSPPPRPWQVSLVLKPGLPPTPCCIKMIIVVMTLLMTTWTLPSSWRTPRLLVLMFPKLLMPKLFMLLLLRSSWSSKMIIINQNFHTPSITPSSLGRPLCFDLQLFYFTMNMTSQYAYALVVILSAVIIAN